MVHINRLERDFYIITIEHLSLRPSDCLIIRVIVMRVDSAIRKKLGHECFNAGVTVRRRICSRRAH